jgi:CxxC motif-containing protein (DUF1111 family)
VNAACASEVGLSTPSVPQPPDPTRPDEAAASGIDLDAGQVASLVAFVASLSPPAAATLPDPGRTRFEEVGCTACHQERIGPVDGAYTDLLLHDLGPVLSDGGFGYGAIVAVADEAADPRERRTPPLWGVGQSAPYLHDGRAGTLEAAIVAHDGEASASRDAYQRLSRRARLELLDFLRALGDDEDEDEDDAT